MALQGHQEPGRREWNGATYIGSPKHPFALRAVLDCDSGVGVRVSVRFRCCRLGGCRRVCFDGGGWFGHTL